MGAFLDSNLLGLQLRERCLDVDHRAVRLARLSSGAQAQDQYHETNCGGFGRVRRFEKFKLFLGSGKSGQSRCLYRGLPTQLPFYAQSFQIAACDLRCWYCFVDDARLSASASVSQLISASEIFQLFMCEDERPPVLDLSGGQPDLVPEWTLWMMEEAENAGMRGELYVWMDDNLANDFFWRFLSDREVEYVCSFPLASRVGCFKGYSELSFAFNTRCHPSAFQAQFDNFRRFLDCGADMYAYATFTSLPATDLPGDMARFLDRLQEVHPLLPIRTLPLKVYPFTAASARMQERHQIALRYQHEAFDAWLRELSTRFSASELAMPYEDVNLCL